VSKINYITTVAGYIHFLLTGSKVVGVGEASGMFPIDSETIDYDEVMVEKINRLFKKKHLPFTVKQIFPKVLVAGQKAGILTNQGALLLDPQGDLQPRVLFAPPEGDAGTGMVSTNAVKPKTGNVSAGTSVFSMIVLNKKLLK
jgi:sugar (pentulose or hexulose) kinase